MSRARFLISLITKDNDYQREQAAAAEEVARTLGVDVQITYAESDPITQSQQLLEVIQSPNAGEFTGIIVEPCGGTSMTQVAGAAIKAKIAWVVMNREIDGIGELRRLGSVPVFSVSSDHEEIGRIQGRQFGALLPKGGLVVYLQGPSASQVAQRRVEGVQETKPHNISLKVLKCPTWTEAGGYQAVTSWLRVTVAHKERIDLIAGQNDLIAMGARKALKENIASATGTGITGLRFTGIDGLQKTGQAWTRGGLLAATVVVPPNTVPALKALLKATTEKWQPPEQTLVTPYSFPEISQLGPDTGSDDPDGSSDDWKY
jgi:ABC-type sugar transport system substrate-binding protein